MKHDQTISPRRDKYNILQSTLREYAYSIEVPYIAVLYKLGYSAENIVQMIEETGYSPISRGEFITKFPKSKILGVK